MDLMATRHIIIKTMKRLFQTSILLLHFIITNRKKLSSDFSLQDDIGESDFHWLAGVDISYYEIDRVDFERLNRNAGRS